MRVRGKSKETLRGTLKNRRLRRKKKNKKLQSDVVELMLDFRESAFGILKRRKKK